MSDRYDVEQSLMSCWGIIDDIKLLSETVLDGKMNTDEVANYLIGLHSVYGLKFQNCFDQFSELQKQQWKERAEIIKEKSTKSRAQRCCMEATGGIDFGHGSCIMDV